MCVYARVPLDHSLILMLENTMVMMLKAAAHVKSEISNENTGVT